MLQEIICEKTTMPGQFWLDIASRVNMDAFAAAFVDEPVLETLLADDPLFGVDAVYEFLQVTRPMFDRMYYVHEARAQRRIFLEWSGLFQGTDIAGTTILFLDGAGSIERIRFYCYPVWQLAAFSVEFTDRFRARSGRPAGAAAYNP